MESEALALAVGCLSHINHPSAEYADVLRAPGVYNGRFFLTIPHELKNGEGGGEERPAIWRGGLSLLRRPALLGRRLFARRFLACAGLLGGVLFSGV